jgi:hypothetical protein
MAPITEPSLGATLYIQLASTSPPAPTLFWAMNLGLPGMCLPMWRATERP